MCMQALAELFDNQGPGTRYYFLLQQSYIPAKSNPHAFRLNVMLHVLTQPISHDGYRMGNLVGGAEYRS